MPALPTARPTLPRISMSLKTTPGALSRCTKVVPSRRKILPLEVVNQSRSSAWYSIAVMSSVVPDGVWLQTGAAAAGVAAASTTASTGAAGRARRTARRRFMAANLTGFPAPINQG